MHIIAEASTFVIRNFAAADEAAYLSPYDDEQVLLHIPRRSRSENIAIFHTALADYEASKVLGRWGLFNKADGEYIGVCLLRNFNDEGDKVELGYVLTKKYWGKGIAGEMAKIMVAYGFSRSTANEIVAVTTLENAASQRVLEKAGLKRADNLMRDGRELAYFTMTKKDLPTGG